MRKYLAFILVLAVLLTAGCVEEPAPANATTNHTTAATPAPGSGGPAATGTPTPVPTPPPAPMAYISGITCGVGDRSEAAYHCNGDIRIGSGEYDQVQVIAEYADNNTFRSGTVPLGGNDAVSKPFVIFPDIKYQGQTPSYFVRMDDHVYPVAWNGNLGVAWSNTPGAGGIEIK